jgi:1,4-alpha-glucan branching enzyme
LAGEHARDFVARTIERLRRADDGTPGDGARQAGGGSSGALPGGGLVVCALDTELLGHWWYEGVHWLAAVIEECSRQGLALVRLDEAAGLADPAAVDNEHWQPSSWGTNGDLRTWSGPAVADMAFEARAGELRTLAALEQQRGAPANGSHRERTQGPYAAALRELLALQASDWPFMISRGLAAPYAHERFNAHRDALHGTLCRSGKSSTGELRNLAPALGQEFPVGF